MSIVLKRRQVLSFEGVKKLHKNIKDELYENNIKFGQERLRLLLKEFDMQIKRRRRYSVTTDSNHGFKKYGNLTKDFVAREPNQLWVVDITYVRTLEGFCYLALVTDAYSRKIVGFDISDSLEREGVMRALKMAIKQKKNKVKTIHHSDHGVQYCCHDYINLLNKNKISISMGEVGNCYENAMAERVNGILKEEFRLRDCLKTKKIAVSASKQAIKLYNGERLHMAIAYKTPNAVHEKIA